MTAPTKPADCSSMVVSSLTWPGAPSNSDICTTAYGHGSPPSPHPAPKWGPQGSPPGQILRDPPSQQPNGGLRRIFTPGRYCEISPASNPMGAPEDLHPGQILRDLPSQQPNGGSGGSSPRADTARSPQPATQWGLRRIFTPGRYCEISPASNPMGAPEDLHPGQILRDLPSQQPNGGSGGSPPRADTARSPQPATQWGLRRISTPGRYCEISPASDPGGGLRGVSPRADTASPRRRPKGPEHRATPGGYGGKPPGVAIIGVPTGARNAGKWCSDGGPEHRRLCYTKAPPCVS